MVLNLMYLTLFSFGLRFSKFDLKHHMDFPIEDVIEKIGLRKKLQIESAQNNHRTRTMRLSTEHFDVCRLLIENIVDKNPADKIGWTPLHLAALSGYRELTKLIIEAIDYNDFIRISTQYVEADLKQKVMLRPKDDHSMKEYPI